LKKVAYFNNAATTFPKPEEVYTFVDRFYRESGFSFGRGTGTSSHKIVQEARRKILELFRCPAKKVVFTSTATEAINVILQGLHLEDNYNIYVTPFEHNAVTRVLNYLKTKYRLNIYTLSVDEKKITYNLDKIKYQFAENKPNVVIMNHASNVCGVIAPIESICSMSHQYGAVNIIDMCQTAGLIDTDLSSGIYDFAVFAGHKTLYATFGIAGFICSGNIKLKPLLYGGTGVDSANPELPDSIPERYEVGSQNVMAIAGLHAGLTWIEKTSIQNIYEKDMENRCRLLNILKKYDNIRIIGGANDFDSIGVVSCVFDGYSSDNIGQVLIEQGIEVRTGLHCSPSSHKFLGTFPAGTVRFSVGYFNDDDDFRMLNEALDYIYENSW
jgi:cysteine desulfurase family protein